MLSQRQRHAEEHNTARLPEQTNGNIRQIVLHDVCACVCVCWSRKNVFYAEKHKYTWTRERSIIPVSFGSLASVFVSLKSEANRVFTRPSASLSSRQHCFSCRLTRAVFLQVVYTITSSAPLQHTTALNTHRAPKWAVCVCVCVCQTDRER